MTCLTFHVCNSWRRYRCRWSGLKSTGCFTTSCKRTLSWTTMSRCWTLVPVDCLWFTVLGVDASKWEASKTSLMRSVRSWRKNANIFPNNWYTKTLNSKVDCQCTLHFPHWQTYSIKNHLNFDVLWACHKSQEMMYCELVTRDDVLRACHKRWCTVSLSQEMMYCELVSRDDVLWPCHKRWCTARLSQVMMYCDLVTRDDVLRDCHKRWCTVSLSQEMMYCELVTRDDVLRDCHKRWCTERLSQEMMYWEIVTRDDVLRDCHKRWCTVTLSQEMMYCELKSCGLSRWISYRSVQDVGTIFHSIDRHADTTTAYIGRERRNDEFRRIVTGSELSGGSTGADVDRKEVVARNRGDKYVLIQRPWCSFYFF